MCTVLPRPEKTTKLMSDAWFHVPELTSDTQTLKLPEHEARHAFRVRRFATGDGIVVFNGHGDWAEAELKNKNGELTIIRRHQAPPLHPRIHLAAALPKGERFGVLLGMTAQLGLTTFRPLDCEHSVVHPGERHGVRGRRILVEACKQSHNPWLPEWRDSSTTGGLNAEGKTLFAHPGGALLATVAGDGREDFTVLVGPEGGFSERETAELDARGATAVSLGPNILRIETAAVTLIAGLRLLGTGAVNYQAESLS